LAIADPAGKESLDLAVESASRTGVTVDDESVPVAVCDASPAQDCRIALAPDVESGGRERSLAVIVPVESATTCGLVPQPMRSVKVALAISILAAGWRILY
jgi:hypothetical protein